MHELKASAQATALFIGHPYHHVMITGHDYELHTMQTLRGRTNRETWCLESYDTGLGTTLHGPVYHRFTHRQLWLPDNTCTHEQWWPFKIPNTVSCLLAVCTCHPIAIIFYRYRREYAYVERGKVWSWFQFNSCYSSISLHEVHSSIQLAFSNPYSLYLHPPLVNLPQNRLQSI